MRSFGDMSIRQKLTLNVLVTSLAALVIAAGGFMTYEWVTYEQKMVRDIGTLAEIIGTNSTAALAFSDPDAAGETLSALSKEARILEAVIYDTDGDVFATYSRTHGTEGVVPPPVNLESHEFGEGALVMFKDIISYGDKAGTIYLKSDLTEMRERQQAYMLLAFGTAIVAALVALLLGSRLQRAISSPLGELAESAEAVAEGDLRIQVDISSNDEIGILAGAFNGMAHGLRKLIGEVHENTNSVRVVTDGLLTASDAMIHEGQRQEHAVEEAAESIEAVTSSIGDVNKNAERLADSANETSSSILQMDVAVNEIAGNMDHLSESIEMTSSSVVEMTQSIKEVARSVDVLNEATESTTASVHELNTSVQQVEQNAQHSQELSDKTAQEAEEGMKAVGETITGMRDIKKRFEALQGVIGNLSGRSESIGEIVKVIDGIAEQTNLLSLNAAIIASQAGEHGKAFAVVAEQVKSLADKTALSTREIASLIESVQDETENAVVAMAEGSGTVEQGVSLTERAGQLLGEIIQSSRMSTQMVTEIVMANKQQAKDIQQVDDAMEQVKEIVQHINTSIHEQDRASSEITRAVENMRALGQEVKRSTSEQSKESKLITNAVENVTAMINQIAAAMQAQTRGAAKIDEALNVFREVKVESGRKAEEMKGMVGTLSARSRKLEQEVGRFRTD
ncbi:MAG: HAMP domain-containing protein [Deltaproteobacteria bacterium]|nr:HAMP domain-containing protein [Deltaproteobacteria bacterium]